MFFFSVFHSRADKTLQDIVYKLVPGLFKGNDHSLGRQRRLSHIFVIDFSFTMRVAFPQMRWNGGGTSTQRIVCWNRGKWWRRSTLQRMKLSVCPYSSTRGTSESVISSSFLFYSRIRARTVNLWSVALKATAERTASPPACVLCYICSYLAIYVHV